MIVTGKSGERFVVFRLGDILEEVQRDILEVSLENNSGKISRVAIVLGITRPTVRAWIKKFRLGSDDAD